MDSLYKIIGFIVFWSYLISGLASCTDSAKKALDNRNEMPYVSVNANEAGQFNETTQLGD